MGQVHNAPGRVDGERETDGERGGGGVGAFHVAGAAGLQGFIIFYKSSEVVKSLLNTRRRPLLRGSSQDPSTFKDKSKNLMTQA